MEDEVETLTSMAAEIGFLRDLAAKNSDDPHWILVRSSADHFALIMDRLSQTLPITGNLPWWSSFQEKDPR